MDPINISTTRNAQGGNTTSTPGGPVGGGGLGPMADLFADILRRKQAQRNARPRTDIVSAAAPRASAPVSPAARYTPTMGSAQSAPRKPERVTRTRLLKGYQDPNAVDAWAGSKAMNRGTTVQEYQLPDGSWSGDALYGTLEGNEAAARQRMASMDEAYRSSGRGGGGGGRDDRKRDNNGSGWSPEQLSQAFGAPA